MYSEMTIFLNMVTVWCLLTTLVYNVEGTKNCDTLGILLYEDIGCKPVTTEGSNCPIKYDCDDFSKKRNGCLLRGTTYNTHEQVNNSITYPSCKVGCFCNENNGFTCAVLDCPEWLGVPIEPGCYRKYEVDKCCSVGQICPQSEPPHTCKVGNETVNVGEKFYPKKTCSKCVCHEQFNGKIEKPFCDRISCNVEIDNPEKLEGYCAPFYLNNSNESDKTLCCPINWVCPEDTDKIIKITDAKQHSDLTCRFGSKMIKLGEGVEKEFDLYGTPRKAKCECILPPLLTCQ